MSYNHTCSKNIHVSEDSLTAVWYPLVFLLCFLFCSFSFCFCCMINYDSCMMKAIWATSLDSISFSIFLCPCLHAGPQRLSLTNYTEAVQPIITLFTTQTCTHLNI